MTIGVNYRNWMTNISNISKPNTPFEYANNNQEARQGSFKLAQSRIELVDIDNNKKLSFDKFTTEITGYIT